MLHTVGNNETQKALILKTYIYIYIYIIEIPAYLNYLCSGLNIVKRQRTRKIKKKYAVKKLENDKT